MENSSETFRENLYKLLEQDTRLWVKKNGIEDDIEEKEFNIILLKELVDKHDEKLLELLFNDQTIKEKFFVKIKKVFVFKINEFKFFIDENKINNSYTQYKNRIGLSDSKNFLKESGEVVLNFPHKDCILQGGQSTEEGTDNYFSFSDKTKQYEKKSTKRKEIYFNQVIAPDEIDRLKDEKALVNWKRFTNKGEQKVKTIQRDADGTIKENLIIKGNNLLALHSLKQEFQSKVKLIYIDPPYNTGNDSFKYNDNFNHSAWLTFIKNRLEVARDLLRDDGVIFVQCDDNEQAYLKVLMDEIFNRDNFVSTIIHNNKYTTSNDAKYISSQHENIHVFTIKKELWLPNLLPRTQSMDDSYKNIDNDKKGRWKATPLHAKSGNKSNIYTIIFKNGVKWTAPKGRYPRYNKEKLKFLDENDEIYFNKNGGIDKKTYLSEVKQGKTIGSLWRYNEVGSSHQANEEISNILGKGVFDSSKPEGLLERILEISTQKGDIVLDYHLGSGTTCAVAHKMSRQYIGIEQMDYVETIAVERLKKVIAGEQSGISKSVDWKGGGKFVYFELAKWNEKAKEEILQCKNFTDLKSIFSTLCKKYFLNYNLKIKEFEEKVIKEEKFLKLSLAKQKKIFLEMLDLNQMYVQKTEMADTKFAINQEDQRLSAEFYSEE